ncbi:SusC/RagA family TonB-linked outer membrane protein [Reichenbachiella agariperforans]|uniref:SusC/RagA family TonB-linked outer membrane protein n=1 Tax=Reichenbachiella agariperforans TaxID=156994 RepID=UPI001C08D2DE|nr:SusC/RagA family TonB-linked outer membrane protein [Reichenbachiella agariperforans]MBU2914557.1 SusC/RagA family TonB-linked outer membrane protein [Reichenbachiella agariperforans]
MYSNIIFYKTKATACLVFMLVVLLAAGPVWANSESPQVSVALRNATLTTIFSHLGEQTGYKFSYGEKVIEDQMTYSIVHRGKQLREVLDELSAEADFSYAVSDRLVLIRKNNPTDAVVGTAKGRIVDENNEPLPGANVLQIGTTNGVVTNINGEFSIDMLTGDQTLVFSFIGYDSESVSADENMVIQLLPSLESLQEVVVIGYGTTNKADVTGALDKVDSDHFREGINTSPELLLQGKSPGVRVISSSGEPGAGVDVMIRGAGSIRSGSTPLFVVDGVPLSNASVSPGGPDSGIGSSRAKNPLNFLNPSDIASISVLKDASAAAIYGARGSNGVIIITTKKGRKDEGTLTLDSYVGLSTVSKKLDLLDAKTYAENNPGQVYDPNVSTDWQDEVFRTAMTTSNSLSFSKGTDSGNYYASISQMDQEGVIEQSEFERISGRINVMESFMDNQRLKLKVNLTASQTIDNAVPTSETAGATGELITHTLKANPTRPVYDENGDLFDFDTEGSYNPIYMLDFHEDETRTLRVLGNVEANFRIINGLEYQLNYGIDRSFSERNTTFYPNTTEIESSGAYYQQNFENYSRLLEQYLTYSKLIGNSKLDVLGGFSYQKFERSGTTFGLRELDDDRVDPANNPSVASNQEAIETTGFAEINELQSYFGRLNYTYKGKYLVTASIRADGSTRFGDNNKYGYFPSFALGWNIGDEGFLAGSDIVNELKLRTSWGQTGNQEVPNKVTQETYSTTSSNGYFLNGEDSELVNGVTYTRTANPDLKWEVVTQFDLGLDFQLYGGVLYGSIDYYNKATTDAILLLPAIQPNFSSVWTNMDGEIVNSGIEFMLGSQIIQSNDVSWSVDFNGATLKNEVKNLPVTEILSGNVSGSGVSGETVNIYKNGYAAGSFNLYEHLGFDENGISQYSDEKKVTESALPTFTYGFNTMFRYKNIDLSMSVVGQTGAYIFNNTKLATDHMSNFLSSKNVTNDELNSGQSVNDALRVSDYYLESSDYIRLNNLRIGYTFNTANIKWLKNLTLYATGQNLVTITDYSGFDPSVNTSKNVGGNTSLGIDYASYPSSRSYLLGATIKF